jgi:hypothetical protein
VVRERAVGEIEKNAGRGERGVKDILRNRDRNKNDQDYHEIYREGSRGENYLLGWAGGQKLKKGGDGVFVPSAESVYIVTRRDIHG